ncbi:MAG: tRNA ((6))-methyltransferase TrmN6 [Myxococcales bacterium]|nr:tRNA ((6))-methyltransferase TrmN6 [Myxococcales bacterium]
MWDAIRNELEAELHESVTIDALTGTWSIAQRAAGNRHSADDVLTADYALREAPAATQVLDLGTGIGGVGLLVLSQLTAAARLVCVEAQAVSHRLLLANIAGNHLGDRVEAHLGDLREFAADRRFPLVTGSPPYFPLGTGILPDDSQKAHARFELRGDVSDYARAAERHLTGEGVFVFCFPTPQRDRALTAVAAAGLATSSYRDVIPRVSLRPLFTLFACRRSASELRIEPPLAIRHEDGRLTEEMQQVRRRFGFS